MNESSLVVDTFNKVYADQNETIRELRASNAQLVNENKRLKAQLANLINDRAET